MNKKIFQLLNPTTIGSEEEKKTQARHLSLLIWASWSACLFVFFTALFYNDWASAAVMLACCALLVAPFALLKRGHLAASSLVVVLMMIGTITLIATVGQGIRDMAIVAFPIIFIFAGLTLNRVYFRLYVGVTLAAISWLAFGEVYGWFTPVPLNYPNWLYLITLAIILLVAALAVDLMAINMRKSLELTRQEISERKRTEEELRESEFYFRTLFDQAAVGVALLDIKTGSYVRVNQKYCDFLGYSGAEMLGKTFMDVTHPDDVQENMDKNALLLAEKSMEFSVDKRYIHKNGSIVWGKLTASPLWKTGEQPPLHLHISIVLDITEHKRAELEREVLYQVLRAVSSQLDLDLVASSAAETIVKLTGYPHVCIALPDASGAHWVVRGAAGSLAAELGATYPIHQGVIGRAFKTGQTQWVSDILDDPNYVRDVSAADAPALRSEIVQPLRYGDQLLGVLNIESDYVDAFIDVDARMIQSLADIISLAMENARLFGEAQSDISERKQAEEQLRRSEADLNKAQAVSNVGSWLWNIKTNRLTWSDEMYRIFGISKENFSGVLEDIIAQTIHPDDRQRVEQSLRSTGEDGKPIPVEYRIVWPDKTIRVVWTEAGELALDEEGKPTLLSGIVQDISERKHAEEMAIASQKLAGIGRLAAGMAHEINSPLQLVTGLSERLTRNLKTGEIDQQQFLTDIESINKNGWRIARIIRSLLTYARKEGHEMTPLQLNTVIESSLLLIEHQLVSWSNVSIEKELAPDLPLIHADSNSLTQVILNLLENARDAMPGGGWIKISTAASPGDGQVVLQISDTGAGIPEELQSQIFDPFFTTKDVGKGTGLGLSIVHGIIQAHGGDIQVESPPGKGTTFTIVLPVKPAPTREKELSGRY